MNDDAGQRARLAEAANAIGRPELAEEWKSTMAKGRSEPKLQSTRKAIEEQNKKRAAAARNSKKSSKPRTVNPPLAPMVEVPIKAITLTPSTP